MSHLFKSEDKGFSLAEMLVTVSIMLIILSVIVGSQTQYSGSAELLNVVDSIQVSLVEASVFGTGVRELSIGSDDFSIAYGVQFRSESSNNNRYHRFVDRGAKDGRYTGADNCPPIALSTDECLERVSLPTYVTVSDICTIHSSGTEDCGVAAVALAVTYNRPASQSRIMFMNSSLTELVYANVVGARLIVSGVGGETRSVYIYSSGQISVQ